MGVDRFVAYCVIKIQNKPKYTNFSEIVYLLQVMNVTGISTKWFQNFQRFEFIEGNFSHGSRELVQVCGSFE